MQLPQSDFESPAAEATKQRRSRQLKGASRGARQQRGEGKQGTQETPTDAKFCQLFNLPTVFDYDADVDVDCEPRCRQGKGGVGQGSGTVGAEVGGGGGGGFATLA